jgi:hypothetical protein
MSQPPQAVSPVTDGVAHPVTDPVVMVIRHAEKPTPAQGGTAEQFGVNRHGQPSARGLTPRGWSRAGALAVRFDHAGQSPDVWRRPARIHAAPPTDANHSHRCVDTAEPIADRLGVHLHRDHERGQEAALADEIRASGLDTLVVWDHRNLPDLLRAFTPIDAQVIPDPWPGDRFDLMALLTPEVVAGRSTYRVSILAQDLLSGDASQ